MDGLSARHARVAGDSGPVCHAVSAAPMAACTRVLVAGGSEAPLGVHAAGNGVERAISDHGSLEILVADVGCAGPVPFAKSDAAMSRWMMDLNRW